MNDGRSAAGSASHARALATRSSVGSFLSYGIQYVGRMPPIAASLPGQNIVAARRPWRIAVTHTGSPPHQRGSLAVSADMVNRSGIDRSRIELPTTPWCSG